MKHLRANTTLYRFVTPRRATASLFITFSLLVGGFFAVVTVIPMNAKATTLYVGGVGPGNYTTIQEALDAASPGDTVFVYNGTYYEYITVSKRLSLVGENKNTTVIYNTRSATTIGVTASWANISGFTLTTDYWSYAIGFNSVNNVTIADNIIMNHWGGLGCYLSNDSTFQGNRITTTMYDGISVGSSLRVRVLGNALINTGISVSGDSLEQWDTHVIDTSNTVNGKPVYYWKGIAGGTVPNGAGEVILANSTGVTVGGQDFNNGGPAVLMGFSSNNVMSNNVISSNTGSSVSLTRSNDNVIANNTISGGNGIGLILDHSDGNTIENNTLRNNNGMSLSYSQNNVILTNNLSTDLASGAQSTAIQMYRSGRNVIDNNTVSSSYYSASINLALSLRNRVANNTVSSGQAGAISVSDHSDYTILTRNKLWNSLIDITSSSNNSITYNEALGAWDYIRSTDSNDNVAMYNPSGISFGGSRNTISFNAGNVGAGGSGNLISNNTGCIAVGGSNNLAINNTAVGCSSGIDLAGVSSTTNNTIAGNIITDAGRGIDIYWSGPSNIIANNLISSSRTGIFINASSGQTIVNNTISGNRDGIVIRWLTTNTTVVGNRIINNDRGIWMLVLSSGNTIYHNDFVGNTVQSDDNFTNTWDDGYPSGGNYWSDYTGVDGNNGPNQDQPGSDGIGDTPYSIPDGSNKDGYPLMTPTGPGPWPPYAPRNMQASAGNGQATLTWSPPSYDGGSPIMNYSVYRGTVPSGETFLTEIGNVLIYADSGLTNGQTYYYQVSAKNVAGEGPRSTEANATPTGGPTVPGPPIGLATSGGIGQITLTWSPPTSNGGSPITNYRIRRDVVSGGESFLVEIGNVLAYIDAGLGSGQRYYYAVTAKNAIGEGPKSNEASAKTFSAPSPPIGLAAMAGNGQVTLTWSPPADNGGSSITNYRVYRGTASGVETFTTEIGNVLTYIDTSLVNGQRYYYKVSAKNAVGEGPQSSETSAVPATTPGPPIGLSAVAGNGQVTLTWSAPSDNGGAVITNYMVYRGTISGGETFIVQLGNVLSHTDTGLANGQKYYYKVSAVNDVGEGQLSNEASATPSSGMSPPSEPNGLQAAPGNQQVTLTWMTPSSDGGSPITRYVVYRGTTAGGETLLAEIRNVLTYIDAGLANGQMNFYKVSAVNAAGEGPKSNEASATPVAPPPTNLPPTCNIVSPVPGSTVAGTYRIAGIASDVDGTVRKVEVKIDNGEWIEASGNTSWIYDWDTTDVSNGQHTIRARSYDGTNNSVEVSVTVTVDNAPQPPPQETSAYQWAFWAMLAVAIVETALLLFLLSKGKRGKKSQEEQPARPSEEEGPE